MLDGRKGGDGIQCDLTGTPIWYAGGGGGGRAHGGNAGPGGKGGGGDGHQPGLDGTGGGGGGGSFVAALDGTPVVDPPGAGGSGIVVIRYEAPRAFTHTARGVPIAWYQRKGVPPPPDNDWHALDLVDSDGDGFLNWQEYVADTDPMDPDDHFPPVGLKRTVDGFKIVINPTSPDRRYHVDNTVCLIDSAWTNRFSASGTGGRWSWNALETPMSVGFYRSRVTLPED